MVIFFHVIRLMLGLSIASAYASAPIITGHVEEPRNTSELCVHDAAKIAQLERTIQQLRQAALSKKVNPPPVKEVPPTVSSVSMQPQDNATQPFQEEPVPSNTIPHTMSSPALPIQQATLPKDHAYQDIQEAMLRKAYPEAIAKSKPYLTQPISDESHAQAQYWLAQCYLIIDRKTEAKQAFATFVKRYPKHEKVPDALLRLGLIATEEPNNLQEARAHFKTLTVGYPNSKEAHLAKQIVASF
jgi:tol-pal system protein YbgF